MARLKKTTEPEIISNAIKIKRSDNYADNNIIVAGMDLGRSIAFNNGEVIEVTKQELEIIGKHRWLEVINGS